MNDLRKSSGFLYFFLKCLRITFSNFRALENTIRRRGDMVRFRFFILLFIRGARTKGVMVFVRKVGYRRV